LRLAYIVTFRSRRGPSEVASDLVRNAASQFGVAVLKASSQNVKYCYERALEAEARADASRNPEERIFYYNCEKRWLALAASYEYQERLAAFLQELRGFVKAPICSACGLPMRPKRLAQTGQGLFEFQFKCANCETSRTASGLDR